MNPEHFGRLAAVDHKKAKSKAQAQFPKHGLSPTQLILNTPRQDVQKQLVF
jgi:hypothetical protein